MTRWNLSIPEETDRTVRTYLARTGLKKGSLSAFVDEAVRSRVFELTVRRVKANNADADPAELARLIDDNSPSPLIVPGTSAEPKRPEAAGDAESKDASAGGS